MPPYPEAINPNRLLNTRATPALRTASNSRVQPLTSSTVKTFLPSDLPPVDSESGLGGLGSKIIDLLSRGVYASAGAAKEITKNIQGDADAGNPFAEAWKGVTGEEKETYSDVITEIDPDAPEWVKLVGGLAGDIVLDPANLLLGGATTLARAGIKATQAGKVAAKATERAANAAAKPLTAVQKSKMPTVKLAERSDTVLPLLSQNRLAGVEANSKVAKMLMGPRRKFTSGFGFEEGFDTLRSGANTAETMVTDYGKRYLKNTLLKKHKPDSIEEAYSGWKRGVPPTDPEALAAHSDLMWGVNQFTDLSNPALHALLSHKEGIGALQKEMKSKGIPHEFNVTAAMRQPAGIRNTNVRVIDPQKVIDQVKDWDVKNPVEFMDQMHHSVMKATVNMAYADDVVKNFFKTSARPGMVKMNFTGDTALGAYFKTAMKGKQHFVPKEIAERLQRTDEWLRQPTNFKDSTSLAGKAINSVITPAMNIWKPYITIARPGHHVRNVYSDMMISAMDGVMSPRVYTKSLKTLQAGGALKRLGPQGLSELKTTTAKGSDTLSTVRLKGRNESISTDQTYKLAYNQGLLPSHNVSEDFLLPGSTTGSKKTVTDRLLENKYMRGMGVAAEQSNHYTRMAHFISKMEDKKFTRQFSSVEDAAAAAATRVKKYHPDPTGLTPFERKNLRVLIPFYQWQRQTLPMVLNAAISKPGKVTGLNKIGYEVAKATGMNPESIGDPFPTGGTYPSFVRDNLIGPIAETGWGQLGTVTGSPQESIFGDILNAQPQDVIGSNLNPLLKMPIELLSGTDVSTGRPIRSQTEYTDQQIPQLSYLAKAAGISPTSLISNLLSGQGIKMNPTLAAKRGETNPGLDIINWLTGAGISDFNKGSYKSIAMQEKKDDKP